MTVLEHLPRNALHAFGPPPDSSHAAEWQLVQRIVASPAFVRSALLTNFLLYVCDRKLKGKEDEITEHQIGVYALGRPANYHPGEDNIVRNYARMLRKRLEEYFEGEGHLEELRILIPRGQYVPTFEHVQAVRELQTVEDLGRESSETAAFPLETLPSIAPTAPASNSQPFNRRAFLISATALAGASALGWAGFHRSHTSAPAQLFQTFWSQIFSPTRESFVVTGDSGLVLVERLTGHDISLNEYADDSLSASLHGLSITSTAGKGSVEADQMHYTSTADLKVAIALDRLAMAARATPKIRNAREMRMADVKTSNGVFIGGPRANPWIELFASRSNFQMKFYPNDVIDHATQSIWNKSPRPGEQQEYLNSTNAPPFTTYTMVSFLPSLDEEGWVMLLQGQNLSGTGAAGEFVTNMNAILPVLQKARKPDGSIGTFEIILRTQVVGTDAPKASIVVERYQPMKPS